jgi:hypothetical protein
MATTHINSGGEMTTKAGKERAANVALVVIAIIGLLVPVIVGVLVGVTPDTTLRVGDVGTFETSNTSSGGFFTPSATTLQTSTGSIVVLRPLSVVRGQRLRVEDRLKSGLQLCVQTTPPTCADVAGQWTGQLQPVGQQSSAFTRFVAHVGIPGAAAWFSLGLIATLIAIFALAGPGGWSSDDESSDGTEPSGQK